MGGKIVLGNGRDNGATLIHEVNHAKQDKGYKTSAFNAPSRGNYIHRKIDEETEGTVQQIQAAQEFRAAGHNLHPQPAELEYDNAYQNAKANGASDADAKQAGRDAVEQEFYNGGLVTSTNNKTYSDHYGDEWDSVHGCFLLPWC